MSSYKTVAIDDSIMENMRAICLALPEVEELIAYGAPTFKVDRKHFAMLNQHEGRVTVWCKSVPDIQQELLAEQPERYFPPPFLGTKGWVGAWLDEQADPDWDQIAEIVHTSYRQIASAELVALLDASANADVEEPQPASAETSA